MSAKLGSVAPSEDILDPAEVQRISNWLIDQGLASAGFEPILSGFCERLVDAGVGLWRGMIAMRTLHPSVDAETFVWHRGGKIESERFVIDRREESGWSRSPLQHMLETRTHTLRRKLEGADAVLDFPVLKDFHAAGATDYYARVVEFDAGASGDLATGLISSWTTDRPGGFSDGDIAVLDRLVPRLALTFKGELTKEIAENVLDTYVGPDAGRRIMAGDIRRGSLEVIRAAILLADLRGFTAVTDSVERYALAALLDEYYERMVPPILDHGGQVLKYMGDGLLATFNLAGRPRDSICSDALAAACQALSGVAALNAELKAAGRPVMGLDIAVHLGDVLYGNVGAADRLDFTVIGPAVNEASRIEALCRPLGRNLLVSEAFAATAVACAPHLISVGRHELRGVRGAQELFTMEVSS